MDELLMFDVSGSSGSDYWKLWMFYDNLVGGCNNNGGTNNIALFEDPMNYKDSLGCKHNIAI